MEAKNLFQLWRESNEQLPFKAIIDSWSEAAGHYALIEKIEIEKWPYGTAYGQYFFHGKPGRIGKIDNAGCYRWKIKL